MAGPIPQPKGRSESKSDQITGTLFALLSPPLSRFSFAVAEENHNYPHQVDSIDLYQIHSPTFSVRNLEVWAEAMAEVFKEGLIKAVGVSNYNRAQVNDILTDLNAGYFFFVNLYTSICNRC